MARVANSGSFKPGKSGNPGGQPKSLAWLKEEIAKVTPEIFARLLDITREAQKKDSVAAATLLLAYGYGKPVQAISNADGTPLGIIVLPSEK